MPKNNELHYCGTNLPPDLYETVVVHADIFGRSISKEILFMVREAIQHRTGPGGMMEFAQPKKKK